MMNAAEQPEQMRVDKPQVPATLSADSLLTSEFDYIAQSAFQANEDRARVSTYYVVTFGTLVGAFFSLQVENAVLDNLHRALIIVFLTLTLFGISTLLQLVRLRQAWTESVRALNQIKAYYIDQFEATNLNNAFRWQIQTIPKMYKPWSMAFLLALQVALLGGVSLGAAVYFIGLLAGKTMWLFAIFAGLIYMCVQIWFYRQLLEFR